MSSPCPFCDPAPGRVFLRWRHVFALWDGFPVADGHALVVPYRHVATWFDASPDERAALYEAVEAVCAVVRERYGADGFNVGMNLGEAAGQTVPHLHLHVIPRRRGDVPDPRGGVRHVIPGRGNYLRDLASTASARESSSTPGGAPTRGSELVAGEPRVAPAVLTTGGTDPLLPRLERDLAGATRVDVAVAFVLPSGVDRLYPHFEDALRRGGVLRLVTGDYLDVTDPDALQRLLDLATIYGEGRCALRVFESEGRSFHPKAYLASLGSGTGVAYVGSSNLSGSALLDGVEWNYRVDSARDADGWVRVLEAFEALFVHPSTRALDDAWLARYRARRAPAGLPRPQLVDEAIESPPPPPEPNTVQCEALAALAATREAGNRAGLVVMATGLGKTWLAAFDTARPEFRRILFVAHREEILNQAVATFRRIRPSASIGLYSGAERASDAQLVFASVQTLSRREHLDRFHPSAFDYVVVDEFHHAAAATYRRLIDYFDPKFLLGLTATPERADGGDLLALCGENLVYRCAVPRGIALGLLCPFDYFGVPDDVDYANIPWRSRRFDEEALTAAVATQRRAQNVFEQWRERGGARTVAFCVSVRHADFMRAWFREHGVACAAVHSGPTSDPRAASLERLADGELKVIFTVDVFNEGVDVPAIDTVMMLRPTESQVVWMQQFGRGLRVQDGKRLKVVDYIGNHRAFLLKARTLLEVKEPGDAALRAALERLAAGELELPPGCHVTYELEALNVMRALLRGPGAPHEALRDYYVEFKERHGERPTASEAFHDGYLPRSARPRYGSWFGLVQAEGDFAPAHLQALEAARGLLEGLETTAMTRSFKMLLLLAMLNLDALPGPGADVDALSKEFRRLAERSTILRSDVGPALSDDRALRRSLETNPIAAWTGTGAIPGAAQFVYEAGRFRFATAIPDACRGAFQQLVRELVDWRLAEYLSRARPEGDAFVLKVSHANGRPILFLPDRDRTPGIPEGWVAVTVDGVPHEANFVKIAVNVVRASADGENALPGILRGWFGADAGLPGTDYKVACRSTDDGWVLEPVNRAQRDEAVPFTKYAREQIPRLFGAEFNPAIWNAGFVPVPTGDPKHLCLLVTLRKDGMASAFQYGDRFLGPDLFQWQSQNRTRQDSAHGRLIREHERLGVAVHLFVRRDKKRGAMAAPFVYCGPVSFVDWEGDAPITVRWRLAEAVPGRLAEELSAGLQVTSPVSRGTDGAG